MTSLHFFISFSPLLYLFNFFWLAVAPKSKKERKVKMVWRFMWERDCTNRDWLKMLIDSKPLNHNTSTLINYMILLSTFVVLSSLTCRINICLQFTWQSLSVSCHTENTQHTWYTLVTQSLTLSPPWQASSTKRQVWRWHLISMTPVPQHKMQVTQPLYHL